jgi:hypothetical protein
MNNEIGEGSSPAPKTFTWPTPAEFIFAALLLVFLVAAVMTSPSLSNRAPWNNKLHTWNVFHYAICTKYFDEVGYHDFYKAVLLADLEMDRIFSTKWMTRDLHTYKKIRIGQSLGMAKKEGLRERFTDERWEEFKGDLQALLSFEPNNFWKRPIADRGFNPSPAWLFFHKPFLNSVDISKKRNLLILSHMQLPFYLLTFLFVWWAFGSRKAILIFFWFILFFENIDRVFGGYFSYDWFFLTVIAVSLYKKGYYIASGPILAYVAMMRGFPGLLALHPALQVMISILRKRKPKPQHMRFLASLIVSCLAIVMLSSIVTGGFSSWLDWKGKIETHSTYQVQSAKRVGLEHLFVQNKIFNHYNGNMIPQELRVAWAKKNRSTVRALQVILMALTIAAMIRRSDYDGLLLGFIPIFALTLISRYYFSVDVLLLTFVFGMSKKASTLSVSYLFGLLLSLRFLEMFGFLPSRPIFIAFNIGMLVYFIAVATALIVYDFKEYRLTGQFFTREDGC